MVDFSKFLKKNKSIAIDSETTGLFLHHGCRAFMVTACDEDGLLFKWLFRVNPFTRNIQYDGATVREMFNTLNKYGIWIFHNAVFDMMVLKYINPKLFSVELYESKEIHDTMIMAHTHKSVSRLGLKPLAMYHLGIPEDDEHELHDIINISRRRAKKLGWAIAEPTHPHLRPLMKDKKFCDYWLPYELATRKPEVFPLPEELDVALNACSKYALTDVERTMGLFIYFKEILERRGDWDHYFKHSKVILPTYDMMRRGFKVNETQLPKTIIALTNERKKLVKAMATIVGDESYNPNSGPQTAKFLYELNKLEIPKFTDSGNPSTDKDSLLELLEYPDLPEHVEKFINYKITYNKFTTADQYLKSYDRFSVEGYVYPGLKIPGTKTLRFSCRDPNAQNVSKLDDSKTEHNKYDTSLSINLRNVFGPPEGYLWFCIDYTQLQLRIFAECCKDPLLQEGFRNNLDIHNVVACRVFKTKKPTELQRRAAKGINFGIIFGAGARKIEAMTKVPGSYKEFKAQFPLVDQYLKEAEQTAKKQGFIRTLGGYPLYVERRRGYKACNIIVQGTEGELVKDAMCRAFKESKHQPFVPIMMVHDEIIFQSKKPMNIEDIDLYRPSIETYSKLMMQASLAVGVPTTTDAKVTNTAWAKAKGLDKLCL